MHFRQEGYRIGANSLATADGVHALAGFGFDADLLDSNAERRREFLARPGNVGREFGLLKADRGVDIHDGVASLVEELSGVAEKQ